MARPTRHDPDEILDGVRALVLERGPRGAVTAAITARTGAPVGSLYHRWGSRDGLLAALWLRTAGRFQAGLLAAAAGRQDACEATRAAALWTYDFAAAHPEDARLLLGHGPRDLLDGDVPAALAQQLAAAQQPVAELVRSLARGLFGHARAGAVERVTQVVVDLPYGVVRRRLRAGGFTPAGRTALAATIDAILRGSRR